MKHILRFSLFEEIHPRDIHFVSSEFDKYFTISFEFEIETSDRSNIKIDFEDFDEQMFDDVASMVFQDLEITNRREKKLIKNTLNSLLDHVEHSYINIELFDKIFDDAPTSSPRDKEIISYLKAMVMSFISQEDLGFLKRQAKKFLPNFTSKWSRKLDYVGDATLSRGIEIKPKKYVKSISEGIELLSDFYNDLNSQDYWSFSERTGLHINIGTNEKVVYNPIKGLLLMNDFTQRDNIPLVFKDMTWRMNNKFCGSLLPSISSLPEEEKRTLKQSLDLRNVSETEKKLNDFLESKVKEWGHKNYGFNITKIQDKYVEFRYAGGEISKEVMIEKVKYFCFLVYCMTNQEYKRKEYLGKLYKFIDNL